MKNIFLFFALILPIPTFSLPLWAMGRTPPRENIPAAQPVPAPAVTLQECFESALKRSETLAISKEEIEVAEAQFFKAAGEALGDVRFEITDLFQEPQKGGGGDGSSGVGGTFTRSERRERKFIISQPLFQGFRALGAVTGAGSLHKQRSEEWKRAAELLYLDTAHAFYTFLQYQKEVRIMEEIHQLLEERISELEKREEIGRSRTSEVVTAETRMRMIEAGLARSRGALRVAGHLLEFLIGRPGSDEGIRDEDLPSNAAGDLERYLETAHERSDVQAAREAMKTAKRGIVVAQSDLWPDVSLEHTQYEMRDGFQSGIDWELLFKVDIPLFQGGGIVGNVKESVSVWKKAKWNYQRTLREAELDIKESYENWKSSLERQQALAAAVRASDENFRLQNEEYARNLVSNLDVLDALESLFDTRREHNLTSYEMKENYWRLWIASGGLREPL